MIDPDSQHDLEPDAPESTDSEPVPTDSEPAPADDTGVAEPPADGAPEINGPLEDPLLPDEDEEVHLPVEIDGFAGPLELLVSLIATHEMDIQKVPISAITGEYLARIRAWEDLNLDLAGEYLVLSSTLVRYKSRSLLPREEKEEEEEEIISDDLLRQRQLDYERFRQAAMQLRERREFANTVIPRPKPGRGKEHDVFEYAEVSIYDLYETFKKIIADLGEKEPVVVEDESYSVDEKMIELESFLNTVGKLHLPSFLRTMRSKLEIIVTFLALLELIRLRVVIGTQEELYGDIWLVQHPSAARVDDEEEMDESEFEYASVLEPVETEPDPDETDLEGADSEDSDIGDSPPTE